MRSASQTRLDATLHQRSTRECSQAMLGNRNIGYDVPRAKLLKRHPAGESSQATPRKRIISRDVSSVQHCHEILSRHTITKYVHEIRLIVIQQDDRKSISQQQQMHDRHMQPSQLNV